MDKYFIIQTFISKLKDKVQPQSSPICKA